MIILLDDSKPQSAEAAAAAADTRENIHDFIRFEKSAI